jgi:hypothetical protein
MTTAELDAPADDQADTIYSPRTATNYKFSPSPTRQERRLRSRARRDYAKLLQGIVSSDQLIAGPVSQLAAMSRRDCCERLLIRSLSQHRYDVSEREHDFGN